MEWGGGTGLKVASAVNNFFVGNLQRPLLGALYAMPSNYLPRPPVIIPITSRTEESVTQRAGQGEGKATEPRINISFTHPASPSWALHPIQERRWTEGEKSRERGRKTRRKETGSAGKQRHKPSNFLWALAERRRETPAPVEVRCVCAWV